MSDVFDPQVWAGVERRLALVEAFIPATPPWRPEGDFAAATSIRVVGGSAFRRGPATRRTARQRALILVVVAVALALIVGAALVGIGAIRTALVPPPNDHGFFSTNAMVNVRTGFSTTKLADGRVLIAGGDLTLASAELFDPGTRSFEPTGRMAYAMTDPVGTLLRDGRVLFTGYRDAAAQLYDPTSRSFGLTGPMGGRRWGAAATLLPDGRVLLAGGKDGDPAGTVLATAELYDPATGTFSPTGSMGVGRLAPTATLLRDGRVLIVGGEGGTTSESTAEVYDPASGRFSPVAGPVVSVRAHAATMLSDGRVLVLGGWDDGGAEPAPRTEAQVFDPVTSSFAPAGSLTIARASPSATLLPDGRVLVAGGGHSGASPVPTKAEIYDPATGTSSLIDGSTMIPFGSSATPLNDGDVLIVGEEDGSGSFPATPILFDYRLDRP